MPPRPPQHPAARQPRQQPPTFHPDDPGGRAAGGQAAEGERIALQQHLVLQLDVENGGEVCGAGGQGKVCGVPAGSPPHPAPRPCLPDSLGACCRPAAEPSSRSRLEGMLGCEDIFSFLARDSPQRSQRDRFCPSPAGTRTGGGSGGGLGTAPAPPAVPSSPSSPLLEAEERVLPSERRDSEEGAGAGGGPPGPAPRRPPSAGCRPRKWSGAAGRAAAARAPPAPRPPAARPTGCGAARTRAPWWR